MTLTIFNNLEKQMKPMVFVTIKWTSNSTSVILKKKRNLNTHLMSQAKPKDKKQKQSKNHSCASKKKTKTKQNQSHDSTLKHWNVECSPLIHWCQLITLFTVFFSEFWFAQRWCHKCSSIKESMSKPSCP